MKLAVIGTGYWGTKIVETVKKMKLPVTLYDVNDSIDGIVPSIIDGVIIATPAATHKDITKKILRKGINVLVEKPAFMNMAECNEIEPYTTQAKLMSGHILLYNEHFDFLKQTVVDKEILHIEHRRLAWGRLQRDINPILHYAPHDIAILDNLLKKIPDEIHSKGIYITRQEQPDFVTCNLKYGKVTVQLQMGWYYHEKVRDVSVVTDKGTLVWNDAENKSKWISQLIEDGRQIQHIDKNITFTESVSPLQNQIQAFIDYCESGKLPDSDMAHTQKSYIHCRVYGKKFKDRRGHMSFKKILAIGAHPDDVELGCSGTLLKYQAEGSHIDIVVCRDDNAPKPSVWRDKEKMQQEYKKAEDLFGIKFNILKNPIDEDGRPVLTWNSKFVKIMDDIVYNGNYDLIITHSPGDHHQDHVNTFHIVNSSLRRWKGEFWLMEGGPYSNKNKQFNPNVFVDITDHIDKKIDLVSCYDSYFSETLLHNIKGLAAYRAQMTDSRYAEAFECKWRTI